VLTKKVGAQGAVGCSRRVGSVRQAYQRPGWTALGKVQGGQRFLLHECWKRAPLSVWLQVANHRRISEVFLIRKPKCVGSVRLIVVSHSIARTTACFATK
jgi:hypothetical protein